MEFLEAKKKLVEKYYKHGVNPNDIEEMMKDGMENYDLSVDAVYNGLRMALSSTVAKDEEEYFTVEDVMSITGETREEVTKRIEEMRVKALERGENPDDYAIEVKPQKGAIYYFPNGIKK